jgi:hypothetical protein
VKLFPYENYYIISPLKPDEIVNALQTKINLLSNISARDFLTSKNSDKGFRSFVKGDVFNIEHIINSANPSLPQIKGSVESYNNGSIIHVKMKLKVITLVFLWLWILGIGSFIIALTINKISKGIIQSRLTGLYVFLMIGYCFFLLPFKYESSGSKEDLLEIFKGMEKD